MKNKQKYQFQFPSLLRKGIESAMLFKLFDKLGLDAQKGYHTNLIFNSLDFVQHFGTIISKISYDLRFKG